jgi:hypothetical protein
LGLETVGGDCELKGAGRLIGERELPIAAGQHLLRLRLILSRQTQVGADSDGSSFIKHGSVNVAQGMPLRG